jgi:hypothetical protein
VQTKTKSSRRAIAARAPVAVLLATWLSTIAFALATDDSPPDSRSAAPRSLEAQAPSARPGRAGPASHPLGP